VKQGGNVVFEERLALGVEDWDGFLLVSLGDNESQIKGLASALDLLRLEAGGLGALLLSGIGRGGNDLEREAAGGSANVGAEHLFDTVGVVLIGYRQTGDAPGGVEAQGDWLLDLRKKSAGARRQSIEATGGKVTPDRKAAGEEVHQQEQDGEQNDGEGFNEA
jgi:hypothetical protein